MKVVSKEFASFECPACQCGIDEEQSVFYPYEPHNNEVELRCPGCEVMLFIRPTQTVTFAVRTAPNNQESAGQ